MYRYETVGYLNWANQLLAHIQANPKPGKVNRLIQSATVKAVNSNGQFYRWNYLQAVYFAGDSYENMAQAATILGIPAPASQLKLQALPTRMVPHEGSPIRFPDN